MIPFWRDEPLTEKEDKLLSLVLSAHDKSTERNNASTIAAVNSFMGSGSYINGIASALLTLGGLHAPLIETYEFLRNPIVKGRVPGWGNSFHKHVPDPLWVEVDRHIKGWNIGLDIERVTEELHKMGKNIYPNPSCYTAATAIILGIPEEFIAWLFIEGRLSGWTKKMKKRRL